MWILTILKFFGGLDIGGLVKTAADAYAAKQDAGVKHDAIDAELTARAAALSVQEAQVNASIVIAEQGNPLTRLARPAIAFPIIAFLWKTILWDKVVMGDWINGRTDPLSPWLAGIAAAIISSYFIGRTIEKTVSEVRRKTNG